MPDLRDEINTALQDFNSKPLRKSAITLLDILGYFREHMAERDLLFHDTVAQILEATHTKSRSHEEGKAKSEFPSHEFLRAFVSSCETSPIHHRLDRICTASPNLLSIIKQEGKV